jgi:hypothetical protein
MLLRWWQTTTSIMPTAAAHSAGRLASSDKVAEGGAVTTSINIGTWLWHGGRVRVVKTIETNGGVKFEAGEILRLDRMAPYGSDTSLCGMYFVSEDNPEKSLYESGSGAQSAFEFLMDARVPAGVGADETPPVLDAAGVAHYNNLRERFCKRPD